MILVSTEPIYAYRRVADAIAGQIARGELKPGERLRNERELAEDHGVARMTIARAVRELRARGLIRTEIGKGHFVEGETPPPKADEE